SAPAHPCLPSFPTHALPISSTHGHQSIFPLSGGWYTHASDGCVQPSDAWVKGPASSFYGPEAVGGAINLITQRPTAIPTARLGLDRKSTRLNSSHVKISYAV